MGKGAWLESVRGVLNPVVRALARAGVTPTGVTLFGLGMNIVCGVVIGLGHPRAGGFLLIAAGLCDALDGQLARLTGRTSRFGAFLDSTIDRIDETAVLAGIAAYYLHSGAVRVAFGGERLLDVDRPDAWFAVLSVVALGGSLITSYTRARAEGLGQECKVGAFERPERVVVTVLGLLLGQRALMGAVLVLVVLSWITVLQRILHVQRAMARAEAGAPGATGRRA